MLTSSQYLRPEYMTPLPTTLDSKKSPLALLAQTCSKIGSEPSTANMNQSKSTGTKQQRESSTLIVHDSKKVKAKPIISTSSSTSTSREQRRSRSPREDFKSSPASVSIKSSSSNPVTNLNLNLIDEEHSNESGGGENKSSEEEKKTDSPYSPSGSNKGCSPSNTSSREKNKSQTSTPVTASDILLSRSPHSETSKNPTFSIDNKNRDNSQSIKLTLNDPIISDSSKTSATSFSNLYYSTPSSSGTEIPAYLHSYARLKAASANAQLLSDPVPVYQTFPRKCPDPYCSGHTSSLESKCCGQQTTVGQSHLSAFHNNLSNFLLIPPPSNFPHLNHHNLNESLFGYPTPQAPLPLPPPPLLSSSQALHNLNLNLSLQAYRAYSSSSRYHPYGKSPIFGSYPHLPLPLSLQSYCYYPYSIFGQRLPSNHP